MEYSKKRLKKAIFLFIVAIPLFLISLSLISAQGTCFALCSVPEDPAGCDQISECTLESANCDLGYIATKYNYNSGGGYYACDCECVYTGIPPCPSDRCTGTTYIDYQDISCAYTMGTCSATTECTTASCGGGTIKCFYDIPLHGIALFTWDNTLPLDTEDMSIVDGRNCPLQCFDGHDNDCDGLVDCADSNCAGLAGDPCSCTSPPPTVELKVYDSDSGTNQGGYLYWVDHTVTVYHDCSPNCDASTIGVIFYNTNPGVCPTNYDDYCYEGCNCYFDTQCENNAGACVVTGTCYIYSHAWACGTQKDNNLIAGFTPTPIEVLVDTSWPSITLNAYSPDPTTNTNLYYTGVAADYESEVVSIKYKVDGGAWNDASFTSGPNPSFSFTASGLSIATHTICARARNGAGTYGSESCDTVTVESPQTNTPTEPWLVIRSSAVDIATIGSNGVMSINGVVYIGWTGTPAPSTNDFILRNSAATQAWIDGATGNLYLRGTYTEGVSQTTLNNALSGSNNFIIKKSDGNVVAYFSNTGSLYLLSTLESQ